MNLKNVVLCVLLAQAPRQNAEKVKPFLFLPSADRMGAHWLRTDSDNVLRGTSRGNFRREPRACVLRLGGGSSEKERAVGDCGEEEAVSVSYSEAEGPQLPDPAIHGPPLPKSFLKVSDDGEIWVEKEGQEQTCTDAFDDDKGNSRKVVETFDLGADVPCSCNYCTGLADDAVANSDQDVCSRGSAQDEEATTTGKRGVDALHMPAHLQRELEHNIQALCGDILESQKDKVCEETRARNTLDVPAQASSKHTRQDLGSDVVGEEQEGPDDYDGIGPSTAMHRREQPMHRREQPMHRREQPPHPPPPQSRHTQKVGSGGGQEDAGFKRAGAGWQFKGECQGRMKPAPDHASSPPQPTAPVEWEDTPDSPARKPLTSPNLEWEHEEHEYDLSVPRRPRRHDDAEGGGGPLGGPAPLGNPRRQDRLLPDMEPVERHCDMEAMDAMEAVQGHCHLVEEGAEGAQLQHRHGGEVSERRGRGGARQGEGQREGEWQEAAEGNGQEAGQGGREEAPQQSQPPARVVAAGGAGRHTATVATGARTPSASICAQGSEGLAGGGMRAGSGEEVKGWGKGGVPEGRLSASEVDSDLLWALRSSNSEAAVVALEQGASINLLNDGVVEGAKDGDMGRVSLALRLGGQVNALDSRGTSFAALHWAAIKGHEEVVAQLIDAGADVDMPGLVGATPLQLGVIHAQPGVVSTLLECGANMHVKNEQQLSALQLAKNLVQGAATLHILLKHEPFES